MTLKEIIDKRKDVEAAIEQAKTQMTPLPSVFHDKGFGLSILDNWGRVRAHAASGNYQDFEAEAMDFICREWIKLRPECLKEQKQEAKP